MENTRFKVEFDREIDMSKRHYLIDHIRDFVNEHISEANCEMTGFNEPKCDGKEEPSENDPKALHIADVSFLLSVGDLVNIHPNKAKEYEKDIEYEIQEISGCELTLKAFDPNIGHYPFKIPASDIKRVANKS